MFQLRNASHSVFTLTARFSLSRNSTSVSEGSSATVARIRSRSSVNFGFGPVLPQRGRHDPFAFCSDFQLKTVRVET